MGLEGLWAVLGLELNILLGAADMGLDWLILLAAAETGLEDPKVPPYPASDWSLE